MNTANLPDNWEISICTLQNSKHPNGKFSCKLSSGGCLRKTLGRLSKWRVETLEIHFTKKFFFSSSQSPTGCSKNHTKQNYVSLPFLVLSPSNSEITNTNIYSEVVNDILQLLCKAILETGQKLRPVPTAVAYILKITLVLCHLHWLPVEY